MSYSDYSPGPPGNSEVSSTISTEDPPPIVITAGFTPALIVVDVQNDFVSGSLAVPDAASIIDTINAIIDLPFKVKIATRDFHPDNHVSFAETHHKPPFTKATIYHPGDLQKVKGIEQTLWPIHCVQYTGGADFAPGLNTTQFAAVVHKGTHPNIESYSAFRDIWHSGVTELPELLEANGATDVFFVGLAGDYCVKYTAIDAVEFGFSAWVVTDAVKSISNDKIAWDEMSRKGVKFITYPELVKKLEAEMK